MTPELSSSLVSLLRRGGLALGVLLSGCQFNGALPDGSVFACASDADCPPGLVCGRTSSTCEAPVTRTELTVQRVTARYVPTPSNPHSSVPAARFDTRVEVDVTFNQRVQCGSLSASPALIAFASLTPESETCQFSGIPQPMQPVDTTCSLLVAVRDLYGEERSLAVTPPSPIRVDTIVPSAPQEGDGGLQYVRAPFGRSLAPFAAGNVVTGGPATVEPGVLVRVIDRVEVGRGVASSQGAFGPISIPPDPLRVSVTSVDEAGNESAATPVRDVTWIGTHQGRQAFAPIGNLNRLFVRQAQGPSRFEPFEEEEVSGDAGLDERDGRLMEVTGGIGRWQRVDTFPTNARLWTAFDSRRLPLLGAE